MGLQESGPDRQPDLSQHQIVRRMPGEVEQTVTYPQARLNVTAVCKTAGQWLHLPLECLLMSLGGPVSSL